MQGLVTVFGHQPQLKVRVALFKRAEGDLETVGLVGIRHGDTQLRLQPLGQLTRRQFQPTAGLQHLLGPLQQHMARRCQRRLAAAAIKQHHIQLSFQFADGITQRRRYLIQGLSGSGKAAFTVYCIQRPKRV